MAMNASQSGGSYPGLDWVDWILLASLRTEVATKWLRTKEPIWPLKSPQRMKDTWWGKAEHFLREGVMVGGFIKEMKALGFSIYERDARSGGFNDVGNLGRKDIFHILPALTKLRRANELFNMGMSVCLYIDSAILHDKDDAISLSASHWIVLQGPVRFDLKDPEKPITLTYADYGSTKFLSGTKSPTIENFLHHFYGYVAVE